MKYHRDEKESYKKKVEQNKDAIERLNKEIQKRRQQKKNSK